MPDRDTVPDEQWVLVRRHVTDAIILDVRVPSNPDVVNISTNYGIKPNRRVGANFDIPDDVAARRKVYGRVNPRHLVAIGHYSRVVV